MSEFAKVPSARRSPTVCVFCASHEGPFIDTNVDLPGYGRLNVCCANDNRTGCIRQMARLDGISDPEELMHVTELLVAANDRIAELEALLGNKRMAVGEVLTALGVK